MDTVCVDILCLGIMLGEVPDETMVISGLGSRKTKFNSGVTSMYPVFITGSGTHTNDSLWNEYIFPRSIWDNSSCLLSVGQSKSQ